MLYMNKKYIVAILIICILVPVSFYVVFYAWPQYTQHKEEKKLAQAQAQAIEDVLQNRRVAYTDSREDDPFGDDGVASILLLGLDKRIGQVDGHCDVIQLVEIDTNEQRITITALPRGTYSPLPPGKGTTSSDYYVSNACGLGGLEYGITQIEKILGKKAEYIAIVGFSETLGLLRMAKLPTTETLQWLRHRQGYAIGEPQRAHNHSTFIKQMMLRFIPDEPSAIDNALAYLAYNRLHTNFSFAEAKSFIKAISNMDITQYPERIVLSMKPAYLVQDISYDAEHLDEYLATMIDPIAKRLSAKDYSGVTVDTVQEVLISTINEQQHDPSFISWAMDNALWLQIEDEQRRLEIQYDILVRYLSTLQDTAEKETFIGDYILEMEYLQQHAWVQKGKDLLLATLQ